MKNYKFLSSLVLFSFFVSCDSSISFITEIPLNNIKEHSINLQNLKGTNLDDAESSYFKILNDSINKEQPYVYFYLSYFFENDSLLVSGLKKFPEDPFLKFSEAMRGLNNFDLENLNKNLKSILDEYPHHSLSLKCMIMCCCCKQTDTPANSPDTAINHGGGRTSKEGRKGVVRAPAGDGDMEPLLWLYVSNESFVHLRR